MSIDELIARLQKVYDEPAGDIMWRAAVARCMFVAKDAAKAKEQPVGCSERIEHPFDEIWKGLETIQHKLHDKYHFDLAAIKKVAADTHALCRPYWDEFHCNLPKRESGEVLSMLKKYRVAASRMCDRWAEGDQAVKNELWKALHGLESDALEMIERAERAPS